LISCFEEVCAESEEEQDSAATGGHGSLVGLEQAKPFYSNGSNSNQDIFESGCRLGKKDLPPVLEEDATNLSPRPPYLPVQETYPRLTQIDEQHTQEEHEDFE